jgi:hypothetical protein
MLTTLADFISSLLVLSPVLSLGKRQIELLVDFGNGGSLQS